jgi:hypothetical protein
MGRMLKEAAVVCLKDTTKEHKFARGLVYMEICLWGPQVIITLVQTMARSSAILSLEWQ